MNSRLVKLAAQCSHYAIAKHLQRRGYTLEQTLILLFMKG